MNGQSRLLMWFQPSAVFLARYDARSRLSPYSRFEETGMGMAVVVTDLILMNTKMGTVSRRASR